jgi:hypothetical protein
MNRQLEYHNVSHATITYVLILNEYILKWLIFVLDCGYSVFIHSNRCQSLGLWSNGGQVARSVSLFLNVMRQE